MFHLHVATTKCLVSRVRLATYPTTFAIEQFSPPPPQGGGIRVHTCIYMYNFVIVVLSVVSYIALQEVTTAKVS